MKILFDCFPVAIFFLVYMMYDFYVATMVTIIASLLQVLASWLYYKKIDKVLLITAGTILVLGCTTLITRNEIFLKWKPTVVYWVLSIAFFASHFSKKTLVEYLLSQIQLPPHIWQRLNFSWFIFFIMMGLANLYVAYHYSTQTWVYFKLLGVLGLTFVFILIQALFLAKYTDQIEDKKKSPPPLKND